MLQRASWALALLLLGLGVACRGAPEPGSYAAAREVLDQNCVLCHQDVGRNGGLSVESVEALLAGGESGPAIVPWDAESSLLVVRMRALNGTKLMPPGGPALPESQIELVEDWISAGAEP